ncbi:hypothetical protein GJ744_006692 [Endocarpon pusillum]|uniref:Mitochondrial carrier protein pet8 n=1 Tax=Endocarpon pusillum TaxID=364733 RepID=A0A8H7AJS8_9EURO|nr:hypothetical protein GJ744_006692 [Endocarpon pusillum]
MSFLYSRVARSPLRTSFSAIRVSRPATSSFSTSSCRAALNESDRAHAQDRDDLGEQNEKHKEQQLQEQREGKGKWKKELGSNSEQAIKADRGEAEASNGTIKKMQQETVQAAQSEKK